MNYEDMTYKEIHLATGLPMSTIRQRVAYLGMTKTEAATTTNLKKVKYERKEQESLAYRWAKVGLV